MILDEFMASTLSQRWTFFLHVHQTTNSTNDSFAVILFRPVDLALGYFFSLETEHTLGEFIQYLGVTGMIHTNINNKNPKTGSSK